MNEDQVPENFTLACGCKFTFDGSTREMRIEACRRDCRYLAMTLELAKEEGKPVVFPGTR